MSFQNESVGNEYDFRIEGQGVTIMAIDTNVINIEGNTQKLVNQTNKATNALKTLDTTLVSILNHLTAVEQGMANVNNVTNNIKKQTTYDSTTYDFGTQRKVIKGKNGFMASDSGREKLYREYQQAIIDETKEMTADVAERKKLRKQRADTETQRAKNEAARIAKKEDKSTRAYRDRQDQLAAAKYLNALANQTGKNLRDPKYQFGKTFEKMGEKLGGIGVGADKLEGRLVGGIMSTVGTIMKSPWAGVAAGVNSLVSGIVDLGKAATQAYAEIESIKTQLGVVFSNQTQADAMFGQISQYAVKSPFGVQQTSELAVLLKQSGVYASDLMDTLRMIGDTAGGNMEKMKRIANNYAQIVSIGKASMLDMRQFAYAGIPIFEAVSKELGVSQQELRKLISDGKVTSDIIEKVFKDLTGINGIFENATAKGAKTLKARLQNLQDAKQLAMGELGERIVNYGTVSGNDSYVNRLVTTVEDIYKWIQEHNDTKNIERDVQTIAKREERIRTLEALIEYSKTWGTKEQTEAYKRALDAERAKRNPDQDRTVFAQSYKDKTDAFNSMKDRLQGRSLKDLEQDIQRQAGIYNRQSDIKNVSTVRDAETLKEFIKSSLNVLWGGTGNDVQLQVQRDLVDSLIELRNSIESYKQPTEEEIRAMKEQNIINAQQLSFDMTNKAADSTSSLNASFNELASIYENSEEYKQKQEEKRLQLLKSAQEELKNIVKNTDDVGKLDFNKVSRTEFQRLNKAGAFNATKLDIVEGDRELTSANRVRLERQFANATGKVIEELNSSQLMSTPYGKAASDAIKNGFINLASVKNDEDFFKQFGTTLYDMNKTLEELAKLNPSNKDFLLELKEYLTQSTNEYEVRRGGENANPEVAIKGIFIPLWKRILAQYTGLSTTGMTSTLDTMKNYRNDMAIRNMTSGVLSAAMKTMGVDSAMKLVAYNDKATLKGDSAATLQVDWQKTKENLKEFALSLSASTEVIDAYKKGLEDEMEVYQQLIIAGITQGESQDSNQQKFITTKQLEKLRLSNAQLVNAFGDTIETASGKSYGVNDIYFDENGKLFDKMGNEITEQVKVTSNLSKFIESELPRLRKEIVEADVQSNNNQELSKKLAETLPGILSGRLDTSTSYRSALAGYLMNNQDYMIKQFNILWENEVDNAKGDSRYKELLKDRDYTDILTSAIMATPQNIREMEMRSPGLANDMKLFAELLENTLLKVEQNGAGQLGIGLEAEGTHEIYNLLLKYFNSSEYDSAVSKRYMHLLGKDMSNPLSLTAYEDQGGIGGTRGRRARMLRDAFGLEKGYDLQSLYDRSITGGQIKISDSFRKHLEKKYDTEISGNTVQWTTKDIEDPTSSMTKMVEETIRWAEALNDTRDVFRDLSSDLHSALSDFGKSSWEAPFEKMGENLLLGKEAGEGLEEVYKNLAAEIMQASGAAMVKAGWELVARGAADGSYAMIAGGLALAGAGAFASGIGNGITQKDKETKEAEDKAKRLEALKNNLADLLKQAREDAIYYENTLRHKKAISAADELTTRSVHDAIITPRGEVVTTDPKDYLIATKTPKTLVGGGAPTINFSVVDKSTGIKVTQQKSTYNENTNTIEFEAVIESKIQEVIASAKGDDAFAAREARLRGHTVIA